MIRLFAGPKRLTLTLLFLSVIPIVMALVRLVQIPLGALPDDSLKFLTVPLWHWAHALGGASFGIIGPLQFAGVLQRRYGRLHHVLGRVFMLAGVMLGGSGLGLFLQVPNSATPILDCARVLAGLALMGSLGLSLGAIRRRDIARHKAWIIRAYAIGMGSGAVALVMFPIYLIKGAPLEGVISDLVFVGAWLICIGVAEAVVRRTAPPVRPRPGVGTAMPTVTTPAH